MAKQQQLSPEKYITTKARTLPIHKCYINSDWQEEKMASVVVMRRHVNGKITAGLYLVDLLCLGVKDTYYAFNIAEEDAEERFVEALFEVQEVSYNLAHNIVYAGVDFALEFDIKPHKDFSITRFILEEDTDKIPVIEILVGDEDGNPSLIVDRSYNYRPALQKLKQHAGEGNYTFIIKDDFEDDDFDEHDDDFDDDSFDEYDEFEEDDELEPIDFNIVAGLETQQLEEMIEEGSESFSDLVIVKTELLLRKLHEEENGILIDFDTIRQTKDYQLFEKGKEQWEKSYTNTNESVQKIFPEIRDIGINPDELSNEDLMAKAVALLNKHKSEDIPAYMIINSIPLMTIISKINTLEHNFEKYMPAVQLFIASYMALLEKEPHPKYHFLLNAATVEMAYPFNRHIHGFHHKLFWFLQAIRAIQQNDKEKIIRYHNLLRISGTGGHLKSLYAAQLETWLRRYMGLDDKEHDLLDFQMIDNDE